MIKHIGSITDFAYCKPKPWDEEDFHKYRHKNSLCALDSNHLIATDTKNLIVFQINPIPKCVLNHDIEKLHISDYKYYNLRIEDICRLQSGIICLIMNMVYGHGFNASIFYLINKKIEGLKKLIVKIISRYNHDDIYEVHVVSDALKQLYDKDERNSAKLYKIQQNSDTGDLFAVSGWRVILIFDEMLTKVKKANIIKLPFDKEPKLRDILLHSGLMYLTDNANKGIHVFDLNFQYIKSFGQDTISNPYTKIFLKSNEIVVINRLERNKHKLLFFNKQGIYENCDTLIECQEPQDAIIFNDSLLVYNVAYDHNQVDVDKEEYCDSCWKDGCGYGNGKPCGSDVGCPYKLQYSYWEESIKSASLHIYKF